jgi:hypothetical protein
LVSDFLISPESYQKELHITNRKHDVIAVDLNDPLESNIANVGLLALQDAETGEIVWVDTSSRAWQQQFTEHAARFSQTKYQTMANAGVDQIPIYTDQDYVAALTKFFQQRSQRIRH